MFSFPLIGLNVHGKHNRVLCQGDYGERSLFLKSRRSVLRIRGNNNVITFVSKKPIKRFPSGLNIYIRGDNNSIKIELPIKFKNVKIGMDSNNCFSIGSQKCSVANAQFYVNEGGIVEIGKNCQLGNGNLYVAVNNGGNNKPKLTIGNGVYIARDCIIRASDGHSIYDPEKGVAVNEPEDVVIEDNVWITSRCIILKGSYISQGSIVAAGSVVTKKFYDEHVAIGGTPAKIIKRNVYWDPAHYCNFDIAKRVSI